MEPESFSTNRLNHREQADAWRTWFEPVFDVCPLNPDVASFPAANTVWVLGDFVVSRVSAPAVRVQRTAPHVRRNPIDHWVLSYCRKGDTLIRTGRGTLRSPPHVPFLWSLGEPSETLRTETDRIQFFLSRDVFRDIAPVLDAACGAVLDTPLGRLLGDFMLSLENQLQGLHLTDLPRLTTATRSLIAACVAPSASNLASAREQIDQSRLEKVRQTVRAHLRSPRLAPATLCRAVGMSRSNLYRLLESQGGVARYVQRQRLLEAHALISDAGNQRTISAIAEELCFADASSFGRAFRTMFGYTASECRAAATAGLLLTGTPENAKETKQANFAAVLRRLH